MPTRKRSFAKATMADASPADTAPVSAGEPHAHSVDKTRRLRAAGLCPGGHPLSTFGATGDGCGRCPSVAKCTVARFNPKA